MGTTYNRFNVADKNKIHELKCRATKMFQNKLSEMRKFEESYERPCIYSQ